MYIESLIKNPKDLVFVGWVILRRLWSLFPSGRLALDDVAGQRGTILSCLWHLLLPIRELAKPKHCHCDGDALPGDCAALFWSRYDQFQGYEECLSGSDAVADRS